jgi:hypothetical protein
MKDWDGSCVKNERLFLLQHTKTPTLMDLFTKIALTQTQTKFVNERLESYIQLNRRKDIKTINQQ